MIITFAKVNVKFVFVIHLCVSSLSLYTHNYMHTLIHANRHCVKSSIIGFVVHNCRLSLLPAMLL